METEIVVIDEQNIDYDAIQRAGTIIREGGLVAFPTETVYGLGGDALRAESSEKIYAAKGRPSDNPLIVHISKWDDIYKLSEEVPESAKLLSDAFWPGPLTMILKKSEAVPYKTTGGLDTVAIRMPSDKIARAFIEAAGGYVAAPSANRSGRPSPTDAKYCIEDLSGRIEMIIDGGEVDIGLESTIVDLTSDKPMILRPGFITPDRVKKVLGSVCEDETMMHVLPDQTPKAPGMKYRHYAPKGDLAIVYGEDKAVISYINDRCKEYKEKGIKTGVIGTDETISRYKADVVKSAGSRTDEKTIAARLYKMLREFDDEDVQIMYSESFDSQGLGQAIMNRLLKAAGHKVIEIK